jgi:HK97 family phage major capsid protein
MRELALLDAERVGMPIVAAFDVEAARARVAALSDEIQTIIDNADDAGEDITEGQLADIEAKRGEIERINRQIAARAATVSRPGRVTSPEATAAANMPAQQRPAAGDFRVGPRATQTNHGFSGIGEFAQITRQAALNNGDALRRMVNVQTTYGNEAAGADGGFAIPPEFRAEIWTKILSNINLLTRCFQVPVAGNQVAWPKDETTPWQSGGGIIAYWEGEGAQIPTSKIQLELEPARLTKLTALVPVSDELLEDAAIIGAYIMSKAPQKMTAKINTGIIRGTGVGQPMGILSGAGSTATEHKSVVKIAPEGGQATATVVYKNIANMFAALFADCLPGSVWMMNQDVLPALLTMPFDPAATSKVPVFLPAGAIADAPYGSIFGRPILPVEACSTLGTIGDIIFADLSQYLALVKGGIRTDMSIHLYFDQSLSTFRFIFRMNGQPLWGKSIAPENGNMNRSWAVVLNNRP